MQGTISQAIALTLYGNAMLRDGGHADEGFYPHHPAFMFCEWVRFVAFQSQDGTWGETRFADDPVAWLTRMQQEGVYGLRLVYEPSDQTDFSDRMTVAFIGGGGHWFIEAIHPSGSDFWKARWNIGDQDHPDRLIWQVTYGCLLRHQQTAPLDARPPAPIKSDLINNLETLSTFADTHHLSGFIEAFQRGLRALHTTDLADAAPSDLAPPGLLSLDAAQLLAAAQAAWVFGGMGSWNDYGFEGVVQEEYEHLSDTLFALLNEAYLYAVNSTTPSL